ncbi:hypothetical protein ACFL1N_00210 [Thermodesulfobacteriota bacterium]
MFKIKLLTVAVLLMVSLTLSCAQQVEQDKEQDTGLTWLEASKARMQDKLLKQYGEDQKKRIVQGVHQVADFWRPEDGSSEIFEAFIERHFAGSSEKQDVLFDRFQWLSEKINGHMLEIIQALRWQMDLDIGDIEPFDEIFAAYDPSAHMTDDLFKNKAAFVVLLNFPLTTLKERLNEGKNWSRREWAEARLAQSFDTRVPAEVKQAISRAGAASDQYIAEYNIWMHHLLTDDGERIFPEGMRLLSHWNLRDEIKAQYSNGDKGLAQQKMIQKVMERIVTQTIPEVVINNPHVDWNPITNEVKKSDVNDSGKEAPVDLDISSSPEPDTRFKILLENYEAVKLQDPYSPTAPTHILRSFDLGREISEERVKEMFEAVLSSESVKKVADLIKKRLGRDLEPYDIWYNGFRPRGKYTEQELDKITREKYPDAEAFAKDMPRMLVKLGFSESKAGYLTNKIAVDPARGSGHAWGAQMRGSKARLRTRIGKDGMDYKGYNIAIHEMGHNVEQTLTLYDVDHYLLNGVPNTAFTEAMAFVFQNRDMQLLGLAEEDEHTAALKILDEFWGMWEIAGVALVDMAVWHWMYDNPDATPAQLKEAVLKIARDTWNRYYAPVIGHNDVPLLAIYSHMINNFLYLPNYPIGHLIAIQIEEQVKKSGDLGGEIEKMCKLGNIAPDLWMEQAAGSPVGADALLKATQEALEVLQ